MVALTGPVSAATLPVGDVVQVNFADYGRDVDFTTSVLPTASGGRDFAGTVINVNASPNGAQFTLSNTYSDTYEENFTPFPVWMTFWSPAVYTLTLSSLEFSSPLTGVTFLTNQIGAVFEILSPTSVAFTWINETSPSPLGTFLEVQFDSAPAPSPVPLPAAGMMSLLALGVLGAASRRRKMNSATASVSHA